MKKVLEITPETLDSYIAGKDYIIYMLSEVKMGKGALPSEYWGCVQEVTEARFFDESGELHIFSFEGDRRAVYTSDEDEEFFCEYQYLRDAQLKELEIKKYVDYDEYGQAFVKQVRPNQFV